MRGGGLLVSASDVFDDFDLADHDEAFVDDLVESGQEGAYAFRVADDDDEQREVFGRVRHDRGGARLRVFRPYFALPRRGSACKQLILYTIFINVFVAPWGPASTGRAVDVLWAVVALVLKAAGLGVVALVVAMA